MLETFRDWSARYQRADFDKKKTLVGEGIVRAQQRREKMRALVRADPSAALRQAFPRGLRRALPPEVNSFIEEPVAGWGHLAAVARHSAGDTPECSFERRVFLDDGRSFEASVYGRRLLQMTEYGLWLHGIVVDGVMAVDESPVRLLEADEAPGPGKSLVNFCASQQSRLLAEVAGKVYQLCTINDASVLAASFIAAEDQPGPLVTYPAPTTASIAVSAASGLDPGWTLGTKSVLYLRVDFPDRVGAPLSQADASNTLCGEVDRFYRESSFQRTRLTCTIPERVYRAPQPAAWYATNDFFWQLFLDVSAQASADGYNVDEYDRIFTAFPGLGDIPGSRFTRAAWAFIGGRHSWLNGYFTASLTSHELGHNYGVHHANFWRTFDNSVIGPGATEEYGDPLDIMGTAPDGRGHFNPWFKNMLRWLDDADVQNVTANGTYRVHRFDHSASTGIRALKVARGDGRNYWISLRQLFASFSSVFDGAYVIWGYNRDSIQSDLLDMNPGSHGGQTDSGLPIGSLFEDVEAGISIRPLAKGGIEPNEYLDVEINFYVVGLGDAIDAPALNVRTRDAVPWRRQSIITHDGVDAAESGTIQDTEESWLETTVNGPGTLTFWWQVSSEEFDPLQFFTNGTLVAQVSGEVPWQPRTYQLGAGNQTLRWRYSKNGNQSSGADKAWLDQVSFTPAPCRLIALEAESASLVAPMSVGANAQASEGEYIFASGDNAGTAAWSLDIPEAGAYVLWGRVLALDSSSDSFFVSANGGPEDIYDVSRNISGNWQWSRVSGRGAAGVPWSIEPRIFNLVAGQNTLVFRARESGTRLDQLIITCDTNFVPTDAPMILERPQSRDLDIGQDTTLRVNARGFQPLGYQWRFNGEDLRDTQDVTGTRTAVLNLHNLQASQSGVYSVVVTNRFGSAVADTAITVAAPVAAFGVFGDLSFVASGTVEASLRHLGFSTVAFTNMAGAVTRHRQIVIPSLLRDLASEWTPVERAGVSNFVQQGGKLIVHGSFYHYGASLLNGVFGMDLIASRQSGDAAPFARMPGTAGTSFDDDPTKVPINSGTTALLAGSLPPNARNLYERNGQAAAALWEWGHGAIIFLGWDWQNAFPLGTADGGWLALLQSAAAQIVPLPAAMPVIIRQPVGQPASHGDLIGFTARAEGSVPIAYQWFRNGSPLPGGTNSAFMIAGVQPGDAGTYSVAASNRFGTVVSSNAVLTVVPSVAFTNSASVLIPEGGSAVPYPSRITVSGLAGTLIGVEATLFRFSHFYPDDVDILLVGPRGQRAVLLSDAGGSVPVSERTFTFRDWANNWIADDGPLGSGVYRPAEYVSDDLFLPPAPRGPYGAGMDIFKETDPNGAWSLFVVDDAGGDDGAIAGGWSLRLWMRNDVAITTAVSGAQITLQWPATTNRVYRVVYRNSLSSGGWLPLAASISIVNGVATTVDSLGDQRFYRVEITED